MSISWEHDICIEFKECIEVSLVDKIEKKSFQREKNITRNEGILCGGSLGKMTHTKKYRLRLGLFFACSVV